MAKVMINGSYAKLEKETDHCLSTLKGEQTFFHSVDWESVKVRVRVRVRVMVSSRPRLPAPPAGRWSPG